MPDATVTRTVAAQVRALRRQRGWSARELAEACERAGMPTLTRSAIAKIESGVRKSVTADELAILAQVLEVPPGALLGVDSELVESVMGGSQAPSLLPGATADAALTLFQALSASPGGLPQAVRLAERLASRTDSPDLAAWLRDWARNQADALDVYQEEPEAYEQSPAQEPTDEAYLVFQVQREGSVGDRFRLAHWQNMDAWWTPARGADFVGSLEEVRDHVPLIIEEAETGWAREAKAIRLEFVLPTELINLPVDQWSSDPEDALAAPLGVHYQVAVRSLDRMLTRKWHRPWFARWDTLMAPTVSGKVVRAGAGDPTSLRRLVSLLERRIAPAVLVLDEAPSSNVDALQVGMRAGIPVALWSRARGMAEGFDAVADQVAGADDPREAVRLLRGVAYSQPNPDDHVGSHLSLLWDDPRRVVVSSFPAAPEISS